MKDIIEEIERTENTANRIGRILPDEDLLLKLKAIPINVSQVYHNIPKKVIWGAAASIILLISLNVFVFSRQTKTTQPDSVSTYFTYLKQL